MRDGSERSQKSEVKRKKEDRAIFCLLSTVFCLLAFSLFGCGGGGAAKAPPKPVDLELAQQLSVGRAAYDRGAWGQAAPLYAQAFKRAQAIDDPSEIASAAYNYAAVLVQMGRYDEARSVLAEARAEALRARTATADIIVLDARVARLQGKGQEATELADAVLADKSATPDVRLQAVLVKGQVAAEGGDVAGARAALGQAKPMVSGAGGTTPSLAAGIAELEGGIALLENNPAGAGERFDKQAGFLQLAHQYSDMGRALGRAGDAYAAANQPAAAGDRYYRAGRSALALGDIAPARRWLDAAGKSDPALAQRIAHLRKGLGATQPAGMGDK